VTNMRAGLQGRTHRGQLEERRVVGSRYYRGSPERFNGGRVNSLAKGNGKDLEKG